MKSMNSLVNYECLKKRKKFDPFFIIYPKKALVVEMAYYAGSKKLSYDKSQLFRTRCKGHIMRRAK